MLILVLSTAAPDLGGAISIEPEVTKMVPAFSATGWTSLHQAGVTVSGELDLASAPVLDREVEAVCRPGISEEVREFLLDLGGVTFMDSVGLRAAERAQLAARNRGWRVQVMPPSAPGPRHLMILARRRVRPGP